MRMEVETARTVRSVVSGKALAYKGYGRPPKYTPEERKEIERAKRRERYAAKKKAAGKKVKPRTAKAAKPVKPAKSKGKRAKA